MKAEIIEKAYDVIFNYLNDKVDDIDISIVKSTVSEAMESYAKWKVEKYKKSEDFKTEIKNQYVQGYTDGVGDFPQ